MLARRRNRYNKAELNNIVIGLIFLAGGANCLLGALLLRAEDKDRLVLLMGVGVLALLLACRWFFEKPFHSARPLTTLVDVVTVAVAMLLLNGLLISQCWPLVFAVFAECLLIGNLYRSNRPKRR